MTDSDFRSDHLKLCLLWYDEILVETVGEYNADMFIDGLAGTNPVSRAVTHSLSDVIRPLDRQLQDHIAGDLLAQVGRGYPRWGANQENYTYPEPETSEQYAHNHVLGLIAQEHGVRQFEDRYDIEHAEGRARVAVDAVKLWDGVNAEIPCMLQANRDEKAAMMACNQFASCSNIQTTPFQLFETTVPSLERVPWDEIVQIRKNGGLEALRERIAHSVARAGSDVEAAKKLFDGLEQSAMDAIVEKGQPRVKRVAIESILSNVPGLPVNPFSLFFGIRDTAAELKKHREHGWLYLLREIRAAAKKAHGS
jgi:hypothetical protein